MVKDVTVFHKCLLGGQSVLECVCMFVCVQGFILDFEFWEGVNFQSLGVDHASPDFLIFL